jgi:dTDP-4-amino-4,6-dideoxygalactose transaminase
MGFETLFEFEQKLAEYTGAPYVIATDGCTNAMELCLRYDRVKSCSFTAYTYLSIPMLMHHLGIGYELVDEKWLGEYQLHGTRIWDSARLLRRNMYRSGQLQCLSFGYSKPLSIGKGGCILTDDRDAYESISRMRADGRDLRIHPWQDQQIFKAGYHYCPTLEICKLGLELLPSAGGEPILVEYPDCRKITILS